MTTLLDRYVTEVGQKLPNKVRADIGAEIRSLLEDTLEDRSQAAGHPPDEEMIVEVLREFGAPEKVAASYLPERYLVGPQLYPTFSVTLRVVLAIVAMFSLIGLGATASQEGLTLGRFLEAFGEKILGFAASALQALGNIVLVFAILQRALPKANVKDREWDPLSLKATASPDRVRTVPLLWGIAITAGVILLFNFYPQFVGIGSFFNGEWRFNSILTPAFFRYLPWLNLFWVTSIILDIILLRQGRWQPTTYWLSIGRSILAIVILSVMRHGAPVADMPPRALSGIFLVIILGVGVELGKKLTQLLWEGRITFRVG